MRSKIAGFGLGVIFVAYITLTVVALSSSEVGVTYIIKSEGLLLPTNDPSAIPQLVADDATRLAAELFGDCQEKCSDFTSQLLAIYSEAEDEDVVVIINPGGWGSKSISTTDGWWSILNGVKAKLADSGYSSLWLYHLRTDISLPSYLNELGQMAVHYTSEARNLASRVEFITSHIPDLRVIIAAESNGTMISDTVMNILADNSQVYGILTGPPFWYKTNKLDRTLVMTDNGIIPDGFTQGDILAIIWGQVKYWFRLAPPVDDFGTPPHYSGAPGHDYWWQYPEVRSRITNFLDENFGVKQG